MTILVTGFEPFDTHRVNDSEQLVRTLSAPAVQTLILPVSFARATEQLLLSIERLQPKAVVLFGLAATASGLRLETVARNRDSSRLPDNDGQLRQQPIVATAPSHYAASLPWEPLLDRLRAEQISVRLSEDAGGYVCNHTFYQAAHYAANRCPGLGVGFIHVPHLGADQIRRLHPPLSQWLLQLDAVRGPGSSPGRI